MLANFLINCWISYFLSSNGLLTRLSSSCCYPTKSSIWFSKLSIITSNLVSCLCFFSNPRILLISYFSSGRIRSFIFLVNWFICSCACCFMLYLAAAISLCISPHSSDSNSYLNLGFKSWDILAEKSCIVRCFSVVDNPSNTF
jgi:hypothetical protein